MGGVTKLTLQSSISLGFFTLRLLFITMPIKKNVEIYEQVLLQCYNVGYIFSQRLYVTIVVAFLCSSLFFFCVRGILFRTLKKLYTKYYLNLVDQRRL